MNISSTQAAAISAAVMKERFMVTGMDAHGQTKTIKTEDRHRAAYEVRQLMMAGAAAIYYEREQQVSRFEWRGRSATWRRRKGWTEGPSW